MAETPSLTGDELDQIMREHFRLIELVNEVEFRLHAVAGNSTQEYLQALQQATGSLVRTLRDHLFRQDQVMLPLVESLCDEQLRSTEC